jgi:hypothetical protein
MSVPFTIELLESMSWIDGNELRVELDVSGRREIVDVEGLFTLLSHLAEYPDRDAETELFDCGHGMACPECETGRDDLSYGIVGRIRGDDFVFRYRRSGIVYDDGYHWPEVSSLVELALPAHILGQMADSIVSVLTTTRAERPQAKIHVGGWGSDFLPKTDQFSATAARFRELIAT